ncbi:hypothetical protein IWZ00DRAFT_124626 [Phyllosticta capitalensis]
MPCPIRSETGEERKWLAGWLASWVCWRVGDTNKGGCCWRCSSRRASFFHFEHHKNNIASCPHDPAQPSLRAWLACHIPGSGSHAEARAGARGVRWRMASPGAADQCAIVWEKEHVEPQPATSNRLVRKRSDGTTGEASSRVDQVQERGEMLPSWAPSVASRPLKSKGGRASRRKCQAPRVQLQPEAIISPIPTTCRGYGHDRRTREALGRQIRTPPDEECLCGLGSMNLCRPSNFSLDTARPTAGHCF